MRRAALLALAVVFGLTVAACSGGESTEDAAPSPTPPSETEGGETTPGPSETETDPTDTGTGETDAPEETVTVETGPIERPPEPVDPLTYELSGDASGTVTLVPIGEWTMVTVVTQGAGGGARPSHVHTGSCSSLGDVAYPLDSVTGGVAITEVPASVEELLSGHAVAVHQSETQLAEYIACGDLTEANATGDPASGLATLARAVQQTFESTTDRLRNAGNLDQLLTVLDSTYERAIEAADGFTVVAVPEELEPARAELADLFNQLVLDVEGLAEAAGQGNVARIAERAANLQTLDRIEQTTAELLEQLG